MLSDADIIERIGSGSLTIDPYDETNIEPASVDLRLADEFLKVQAPVTRATQTTVPLDGDDPLVYTPVEEVPVLLEPGELMLAATRETVALPDDLTAQVLGRSSLGRLGVSVHQTAGFIDPGFEGQITLELSNHGPAPVELSPGRRICQIVFSELSSPALRPYGHEGSQYQGQDGATPSGMHFE